MRDRCDEVCERGLASSISGKASTPRSCVDTFMTDDFQLRENPDYIQAIGMSIEFQYSLTLLRPIAAPQVYPHRSPYSLLAWLPLILTLDLRP